MNKVGMRVIDKNLGPGSIVGFEHFINNGMNGIVTATDNEDGRIVVKLDHPENWAFKDCGDPFCFRHDLTEELSLTDYSVCEDCVQFIAYGEGPDVSEAMKNEIGDREGHFALGGSSEEEEDHDDQEFSTHACELCNSHLAGGRHKATLVIKEKWEKPE